MDFFCLLSKKFIKQNKIFKITCLLLTLCLVLVLIINSNVRAESIDVVISQVSVQYNIEAGLIYRVIEAESNFNPQAISRADARGLMQVTRQTWDWICRDYLHVSWDFDEFAFDPDKNIKVGVRFLKWISDYLEKNKDDLNDSKENLVLACYNAGPGAVRNYGFRVPPFEETQNYIQKINKYSEQPTI